MKHCPEFSSFPSLEPILLSPRKFHVLGRPQKANLELYLHNSLNLECPPKSCVLKVGSPAWHYWELAETLRKGGPVEGFYITGGMPLKRILACRPFPLSLFLLPRCPEISSFLYHTLQSQCAASPQAQKLWDQPNGE